MFLAIHPDLGGQTNATIFFLLTPMDYLSLTPNAGDSRLQYFFPGIFSKYGAF